MATVVLATMLGAPVLAAPAHADPVDPSFLSALSSSGIGYNDPALTTELGKSVCPMLVEPGKNFASVAQTIRGGNNGGISPEMASFFTGIAISMYCPSMISSIGDGTVLNQLNGLQGLAGVPGLNGFAGLSGLSGLVSLAG
ncbi:DUF732 domain-containing protein [Mycolicibacterium arenosum]|uniref:DUF732 domain-containing protein n=1 Tax=Mycolicibacterium arenosum TaxID=2952157 RepID=A0ABT1M6I2_9MYCO|nr:DUF732 domain-containing protein [Mycolicibacterium sp. CAU 1645]MCP9273417.1 DUF732 domain-containing protein [Mycolicibacterium sp. CAU 1645]